MGGNQPSAGSSQGSGRGARCATLREMCGVGVLAWFSIFPTPRGLAPPRNTRVVCGAAFSESYKPLPSTAFRLCWVPRAQVARRSLPPSQS